MGRHIPAVKVNPALTTYRQAPEISGPGQPCPAGFRGCGIPATGPQEGPVKGLESVAMRAVFSVNSPTGTRWGLPAPIRRRKREKKRKLMALRGLTVVLFGVGVVLGGCMQSTIEPASEANLTPRDKKLLAAAPYEKVEIADPYQRHIVSYHRKEAPGTIVIDSDSRYLYYVLPGGKAIRYGVTVGEEAMAWSGVAKVGRMTEWPSWTPTAERAVASGRAGLCQPRPAEPDGRARHVSVRGQQGHALPHPRHQPAGIYRPGHFLGLHPHDQRGRHRPLQAGQDRARSLSCWRRARATRRSIRGWPRAAAATCPELTEIQISNGALAAPFSFKHCPIRCAGFPAARPAAAAPWNTPARPRRSDGGRARRCGHRQSVRRIPTAPRPAA